MKTNWNINRIGYKKKKRNKNERNEGEESRFFFVGTTLNFPSNLQYVVKAKETTWAGYRWFYLFILSSYFIHFLSFGLCIKSLRRESNDYQLFAIFKVTLPFIVQHSCSIPSVLPLARCVQKNFEIYSTPCWPTLFALFLPTSTIVFYWVLFFFFISFQSILVFFPLDFSLLPAIFLTYRKICQNFRVNEKLKE